MGFPGGSNSKESAYNAGDPASVAGRGRPPEKEMATHSSILAWEVLWTEEPCRLQSMGSQSRTWLKRLSTAHLCMKLCSLLVCVSLCVLGEGECTEMKKYVFFTVGRNQPSLEATDLEHTNWCKAESSCQWDFQERKIPSVWGCSEWLPRGFWGVGSGLEEG